jgi:hypothetical protein
MAFDELLIKQRSAHDATQEAKINQMIVGTRNAYTIKQRDSKSVSEFRNKKGSHRQRIWYVLLAGLMVMHI